MARRRRSTPSRAAAADRPPELAGHRVTGPVGFGADGAVWAAQDSAGRDVVISVLAIASGSATVRRLAAMRHGTHPHLARIRQVITLDAHRCAVVSDRVDGPTLATVVAARGALDDGELAGVLAGIGSALGHLHERGVIHGDVSPANVIVTPAGGVVLVDLAGQAARELGTPGFVPPERTRGAAAGAAGDVWALARVLEWAGGGQLGHRAAAVVAAALDPRPGGRPTARDLASGAPAIAPTTPVRVPPPAALAQARMRDTSAPTQKRPDRRTVAAAAAGGSAAVVRPATGTPAAVRPATGTPAAVRPATGTPAAVRPATGTRAAVRPATGTPATARPASGTSRRRPARPRRVGGRPAARGATGGVPTRHRGREHGGRLTRWAPAWSVAVGALLAATVLLLIVPRAGEDPAAVPAVPGPDLAVVAELLARRDAALVAQDRAALAATSVPGSPAASQDTDLLARLTEAGAVVEGLQIQATELQTVTAAELTAVVEVQLAQSAHEQVIGTERRLVEARSASCARLELAVVDPGSWRLVHSRPCP